MHVQDVVKKLSKKIIKVSKKIAYNSLVCLKYHIVYKNDFITFLQINYLNSKYINTLHIYARLTTFQVQS